jgi:hypothetical protein
MQWLQANQTAGALNLRLGIRNILIFMGPRIRRHRGARPRRHPSARRPSLPAAAGSDGGGERARRYAGASRS